MTVHTDVADKQETVTRRKLWWLDALVVVLLFLAAAPVRYSHASGDLWGDEAEYAIASAYTFAEQRWDHSEVQPENFPRNHSGAQSGSQNKIAYEPGRLVRLRHFHPPMTVYLLRLAQWSSGGNREDTTLRFPFVLAGSLVVCMVYLCGLALFEGRREVSLACAIIVLVTPLQIRASSHAIPWSLITLGLMSVFYTLLYYMRTARPGWLIGTCGVLGWLFCTTESFFPIALAVTLSLPFVFGPEMRTSAGRKSLAIPLIAGVLLSALIVGVLWPAGPLGGAWGNIQHYRNLPASSAAETIGGVLYSPIPKWAFLYWYSHDYKPYFVLYMLGVGTLLIRIACRKLSRGAGLLAVITSVEVTVAHMTIQFGPQYLAHCLPLLTLMTGFWFVSLSKIRVPASWSDAVTQRFAFVGTIVSSVRRLKDSSNAAQKARNPTMRITSINVVRGTIILLMTGICIFLAHWQIRPEKRLLDTESRISRWPAAAQFLAERWQSEDKLFIGPQPAVVPQWYLLYYGRLAASESQIRALPQGRSRAQGLRRMSQGEIRYVVISSTFEDNPIIDSGIKQMLAAWPAVFHSQEDKGNQAHLVIYQCPPGVDKAHPIPISIPK